MKKIVEVQRTQPKASRFDFLVRNVGKRAILVILSIEDIKNWTEFELHWFCVYMAKYAVKNSWKSITAGFRGYFDGRPMDMFTYVRNASRCPYQDLGVVGTIVESDHFLNDPYYQKDGFWIKKAS